MTDTHASPVTGETGTAAIERAGLIAGLRALADDLECRDYGPLPAVHASYRLTGETREDRIARLGEVAEWLGVTPAEDRMGTLIARRWYGPVVAEGHVSHPDGSTTGYLTRAAAVRAMQAGAEAAA